MKREGRLFVKPAAGKKIPRELSRRKIKPEGEWVADVPYYRRRIREGGLIEANPPAKPKEAKEKKNG